MIIVQRAYYGDCTTGRLRTSGGFQCLTLELPWRGNAPSISCIPEGDYPYRVAASPRWKRDVIWIDNVPERSAIQIHPGNFTRQVEGCILPGVSITDLNGDGILDVSQSEIAFNRLIAAIPRTGTIRFITAEQPGKGVYNVGHT